MRKIDFDSFRYTAGIFQASPDKLATDILPALFRRKLIRIDQQFRQVLPNRLVTPCVQLKYVRLRPFKGDKLEALLFIFSRLPWLFRFRLWISWLCSRFIFDAQNLKIEGDSVIVERQYDDRYHVLKAKMPCLITALAELNEPRYMTPGGIFDACKADLTVWGRADLKDVEDSNLGLKGSPTQIAKASDKVRKGAGEKVALDPAEAVDYIVGKLKEKHVI